MATDPIKPALDAAIDAAKAVSGNETPEAVKVVQRDDRLRVLLRAGSGPAVSVLLIFFALLAADWIPFIGKQDIWTAATEEVRAQAVAWALIILAAMIGVVLWVIHVGRPSRTEIKAGPVGVTIEQDEGDT